jgi:hypothetical protein
MTPEQATALIVAITGLVAALGAIFAQQRQTHQLINSRMTQLLQATKLAAQSSGELRGRDFAAANPAAVLTDEEQSAQPTP